MAETALPVEHLFDITAMVGTASVVGAGPAGNRVIVPVTGGAFEGPRMRGVIVENCGGDWVLARADGTARLDVRITLKTDDGAIIFMSYSGLLIPKDGARLLRTAPYFETADERYSWLNNVQGVATGESTPGAVTYQVYALSV
jgi:hypothetical protein